jgi:hypothetical protein
MVLGNPGGNPAPTALLRRVYFADGNDQFAPTALSRRMQMLEEHHEHLLALERRLNKTRAKLTGVHALLPTRTLAVESPASLGDRFSRGEISYAELETGLDLALAQPQYQDTQVSMRTRTKGRKLRTRLQYLALGGSCVAALDFLAHLAHILPNL